MIAEFPSSIIAFDKNNERIKNLNDWDKVWIIVTIGDAGKALDFLFSKYGAYNVLNKNIV